MTLEDSTTYQLIFNRGVALGEAKAARYLPSLMLRIAAKMFGDVTQEVEARLHSITDRDHLWRIAARLLDATSWDDLLTTP